MILLVKVLMSPALLVCYTSSDNIKHAYFAKLITDFEFFLCLSFTNKRAILLALVEYEIVINVIHKWRTRGKSLGPVHESEASKAGKLKDLYGRFAIFPLKPSFLAVFKGLLQKLYSTAYSDLFEIT